MERKKRKKKKKKKKRIRKTVKCGRVRMIACVANIRQPFLDATLYIYIYLSIYIRTYHTYKLH